MDQREEIVRNYLKKLKDHNDLDQRLKTRNRIDKFYIVFFIAQIMNFHFLIVFFITITIITANNSSIKVTFTRCIRNSYINFFFTTYFLAIKFSNYHY